MEAPQLQTEAAAKELVRERKLAVQGALLAPEAKRLMTLRCPELTSRSAVQSLHSSLCILDTGLQILVHDPSPSVKGEGSKGTLL